jgi:hypothetical protein
VDVLDIEQAAIFHESITEGTTFVKHFFGTRSNSSVTRGGDSAEVLGGFSGRPSFEAGSFQKFYSANL